MKNKTKTGTSTSSRAALLAKKTSSLKTRFLNRRKVAAWNSKLTFCAFCWQKISPKRVVKPTVCADDRAVCKNCSKNGLSSTAYRLLLGAKNLSTANDHVLSSHCASTTSCSVSSYSSSSSSHVTISPVQSTTTSSCYSLPSDNDDVLADFDVCTQVVDMTVDQVKKFDQYASLEGWMTQQRVQYLRSQF